jgi:hypothetical protein
MTQNTRFPLENQAPSVLEEIKTNTSKTLENPVFSRVFLFLNSSKIV